MRCSSVGSTPYDALSESRISDSSVHVRRHREGKLAPKGRFSRRFHLYAEPSRVCFSLPASSSRPAIRRPAGRGAKCECPCLRVFLQWAVPALDIGMTYACVCMTSRRAEARDHRAKTRHELDGEHTVLGYYLFWRSDGNPNGGAFGRGCWRGGDLRGRSATRGPATSSSADDGSTRRHPYSVRSSRLKPARLSGQAQPGRGSAGHRLNERRRARRWGRVATIGAREGDWNNRGDRARRHGRWDVSRHSTT
jgi:hypothetical protein